MHAFGDDIVRARTNQRMPFCKVTATSTTIRDMRTSFDEAVFFTLGQLVTWDGADGCVCDTPEAVRSTLRTMGNLSIAKVWNDVFPAWHIIGGFAVHVGPRLDGSVELAQVDNAGTICGSVAGSDECRKTSADDAEAEAHDCDRYLFRFPGHSNERSGSNQILLRVAELSVFCTSFG